MIHWPAMNIQLPTEVPGPNNNSPINLDSPFEVIVFIIAPIVLIILYFYFRKKNRITGRDENEDSDVD